MQTEMSVCVLCAAYNIHNYVVCDSMAFIIHWIIPEIPDKNREILKERYCMAGPKWSFPPFLFIYSYRKSERNLHETVCRQMQIK